MDIPCRRRIVLLGHGTSGRRIHGVAVLLFFCWSGGGGGGCCVFRDLLLGRLFFCRTCRRGIGRCIPGSKVMVWNVMLCNGMDSVINTCT